jgi:hypothetical protein
MHKLAINSLLVVLLLGILAVPAMSFKLLRVTTPTSDVLSAQDLYDEEISESTMSITSEELILP